MTTAAAVRCAPANNSFNRTQECWVKQIPVFFVKANGDVGVSLLDITQYIALKRQSSTWTELDTVTGLVSFGETAPFRIKLMASCTAPCHATAHFEGIAEVGLRGTVDYTDDVKEDMFNTTSTSYRLLGHAPGFAAFHFPRWNSLVSYRCDNGLARPGTGCVIPKFVPTLSLSLKNYGASADMIRWAQRNMKAHWGWKGHGKNNELRRETNNDVALTNRRKVCYDGTFMNLGTAIGGPGDSDSCDEFPFAHTKESGGSKLGKPPFLNGASCAQVKAVKAKRKQKTEAQQWNTVAVLGKPDLNAPCVRGHIPGKLNSTVGSAYSGFAQANRLIDNDPFWLAVTS